MKKEKSFEEALKRLEEIVEKLEQGELTLDKSLELFEEGIDLSRSCTKKLTQAEKRVEKLLKLGEEFKLEPLDFEEED
ncbi:MAG: hypothetical protein AMJ90_07795 [candidate division Zixibacteria bacterium SM23_73_2]|nr:MAG: hypothetical protein AMJ90_07795 [candidate division Zixibacteria bacterium SM23_73_2]